MRAWLGGARRPLPDPARTAEQQRAVDAAALAERERERQAAELEELIRRAKYATAGTRWALTGLVRKVPRRTAGLTFQGSVVWVEVPVLRYRWPR